MSDRIMYQITAMLSELLKNVNTEGRMFVGEAVDDFIDQISEAGERGVSPEDSARGVQLAADDMLQEAKTINPEWPNVTCRNGCAHCCKMTVAITGHEAKQLLQVARAKGLPIDTARLERQSAYAEQTWQLQPEEDRACLFLGSDNTCQVYEDRPLSCRKYFVVSPPELCNIDKFPGHKTLVFVDAGIEILTTAALTHSGCGFMPGMLLEALDKEVSRGE